MEITLPFLLVVLGLGLSVAEAIAPGAHLVVVGVALVSAGLVGMLFPQLSSPWIMAAIVAITGGSTLFLYRSLDFYGGSGEWRTADATSLEGREGEVMDRITDQSGRVRLFRGGFDPTYAARSSEGEIPEGERVRVTDPGGGSVLTVERVEEEDIKDERSSSGQG
ncbi:MAG: NfeD family protein [Halobacteriaceae archaeon]